MILFGDDFPLSLFSAFNYIFIFDSFFDQKVKHIFRMNIDTHLWIQMATNFFSFVAIAGLVWSGLVLYHISHTRSPHSVFSKWTITFQTYSWQKYKWWVFNFWSFNIQCTNVLANCFEARREHYYRYIYMCAYIISGCVMCVCAICQKVIFVLFIMEIESNRIGCMYCFPKQIDIVDLEFSLTGECGVWNWRKCFCCWFSSKTPKNSTPALTYGPRKKWRGNGVR